MNSFQVVVILVVFILLSWIIKGVLLWFKCRKKAHNCDASKSVVKASEKSKVATCSKTKLASDKIVSLRRTTEPKNLPNEQKFPRLSDNFPSPSDDEADETNINCEKTCNDRKAKLREAIQTGDVEELANAIDWAMLDDSKHLLQDELYQAQIKLKELQNIERIRQNLYLMRPALISELRSYTNPPKVVTDVMMCVYLLLGEAKTNIKTWSAIQGLLCANGKNKLKRMIERHRLRDITTDHLGDVKQILSKYDFQTVCMASEGAAAFFIWVKEVIEDFEKQKIDQRTSD